MPLEHRLNTAKEAADELRMNCGETSPREALRGDFYALIEAKKTPKLEPS